MDAVSPAMLAEVTNVVVQILFIYAVNIFVMYNIIDLFYCLNLSISLVSNIII